MTQFNLAHGRLKRHARVRAWASANMYDFNCASISFFMAKLNCYWNSGERLAVNK